MVTSATSTGLRPPEVTWNLARKVAALRNYHHGPERIRDTFGPVASVRLGPRRLVPPVAVVTSPQGAHDVLARADRGMDKGVQIHVENRRIGVNLFNLEYEPWQPRRRALQPLFTKHRVATYAADMATIGDEIADDWARRGTIDLAHETRRLTLEVLGRTVFGRSLGPDADAMEAHASKALVYTVRRAIAPIKAPAAMPTPSRWRFHRHVAAIFRIVDDSVADFHADPGSPAELIRAMCQATDPATGERLSPAAIREDLFAFLFAGHDTTSTTLAYALWQLGRHPEQQQRLAAEVAALGDRPLTAADVPALPYTTQVLCEALRMCPPAAAIGRLATRDATVDGFHLEAGTNIFVGIWALHHDPNLWDRPEAFDPDRFEHERARARDRWQYLPFGGGPRTCIGDHFAMLEATLALAGLIRRLHVESAEDTFEVSLPFTTVAKGPVPARVRAR